MRPNHSFFRGFVYAFCGIRLALKQERNLRFHLAAGLFVLYFARFYRFSEVEWVLLLLLVGGVFSLELVNSALERAVANPTPGRFVAAGAVKDMAAGAVLAFSLAAAASGVILFFKPPVLAEIWRYFTENFYRPAILCGALALAWCLVFRPYKRKEETPFENSPDRIL